MTAAGPLIEIWLADLKDLAAALEAAELRTGYLSPSERAWIVSPPGAALFVRRLSRIALRALLALHGATDALGKELVLDADGKPNLPGGALHFSVSHTRDRALIAISAVGPIGVDLEGDRVIQLSDARIAMMVAAAKVFAQGSFQESAQPHSGVGAWTMLEAVAKARGSGIGHLLTELGITAAGARAETSEATAERAQTVLEQSRLRVLPLSMAAGWHAALAFPVEIPVTQIEVAVLKPHHLDRD